MKLYLLIAAALLSVCAAALLRLDYLGGERERLATELQASQQQAERLQETISLTEQAFAARDNLDAQLTEELHDARTENQRLAADVAAGRRRLLVNTACPAVPADTGAGRVDDAGTELAADARSPYFAHREQVTLDEAKLRGLQAYVRLFCHRPAATE